MAPKTKGTSRCFRSPLQPDVLFVCLAPTCWKVNVLAVEYPGCSIALGGMCQNGVTEELPKNMIFAQLPGKQQIAPLNGIFSGIFLRKLLNFCDFFNVKLFVNYKICWNLDSSLVLGSEVYRAVEKVIQNLFITHVFNQAGVGPDREQM